MLRHIARALAVLTLLTVATSCALSQSDTTALITKAKQLKQQGQLPQAQKVLEEALAKAPASVEAHYLLAWVLCGRDQKLEGAKHFYEVVRLNPDSQLAKDSREALKRLGLPDPPPAAPATPPQPTVAVETKPDEPAAPPTPPAPATEKQPAPTVEPAPPTGPLKTQLIDDFEAADFAWEGLKRSDLAAGTGKFGGAWLDTVGVTSVQTHAFKNDWSDFTDLQFDCSAVTDDGALITIALGSDNAATPENDFYYLRFPVNWQGWKTFRLPLSAFTVGGKPLGFSHITNIFMASNWGPCKPLPTTQLCFDNFTLVKLGAAKSLVIGSMEDDLALWEGLTAERQLVKEGDGAGRWEHLDQTPQISWHGGQHDWHPFGALHMWVYSEVANHQDVRVVAWSDNPDTKEMDGYRCDLKIDWKGWKELRLEDADFQTSYQPLGWDQIKSLDLVGAGWGGMAPAKPDTVLVFDDVRLELLDATKDLGFMDFDTTARTTFTEGATIVADRAHSGKRSLCLRPEARPNFGLANIPHDWSGFKTLSFWVYSETKDLTLQLNLLSFPSTQGCDGYATLAKVTGEGWSQVSIPLAGLPTTGHPAGLGNMQRLYVGILTRPGEGPPPPSVYFDDFTLSPTAGAHTTTLLPLPPTPQRAEPPPGPGAAPAPAEEEVRLPLPAPMVTGTVLDPEDKPVAGARVLLLGLFNDFAEGVTDAKGVFSIPSMRGRGGAEEGFPVLADKDGLAATWANYKVGAPFVIKLRANPTTRAGLVQDPEGKPVPGVRVCVRILSQPGRQYLQLPCEQRAAIFCVTGPDGKFSFTGMPSELTRLELDITAAGRERLAMYPAEMTKDTVVVLRPEATLTGHVTSGGKPVADAWVGCSPKGMWGPWHTISAADGSFSFKQLNPGTNVFEVGDRDFAQMPPRTLELQAGQNLDLPVELSKGGLLRGHTSRSVRPPGDSGPSMDAENLDPTVARSGRVTSIDNKGDFEQRLLPGQYKITCTIWERDFWGYPDRATVSPVVIKDGETTELNVPMKEPTKIPGKLLLPDGTPAAGGSLRCLTGPGWAPLFTAAADGSFDLRVLEDHGADFDRAGGKVAFYATDAPRQACAVVWLAKGQTTLPVQLQRGGYLTGEVVDENGKAVAGRQIAFESREGQQTLLSWRVRTDAAGKFRLGPLPPALDTIVYPGWENPVILTDEWRNPIAVTLKPGEERALSVLKVNLQGGAAEAAPTPGGPPPMPPQ